MKCPICNTMMHALGKFPFADFDGSLFNCEAQLFGCLSCDFLRVAFPFSDSEICGYYEANDSLYTSLGGVGVGGQTPEDIKRYAYYLEILSKIDGIQSITDVGCSQGGFLRYVQGHSTLAVQGIDIDRKALEVLAQHNIPSSFGSAITLPFPSSSQEMLSYFHVVEHLNNIDAVIGEISRVLIPNGKVLLEVPDAENYTAARVGDWFWLAMKEHVNHFTIRSLCALLNKFGFTVQKTFQTPLPMKSGKSYPSLIVLAQKAGAHESRTPRVCSEPLRWFKEYCRVEADSFKETIDRLSAFGKHRSAVDYWAIGLEFLNLVAHKSILSENAFDADAVLFDNNPMKQKKFVRNHAITSASPGKHERGLVITSYMSGEAIAASAVQLGWPIASICKI